MAKDDFKYIIKTELQLNTGSINKLLTQVKEVDKQIKQHFDNAKNSGIKVPLSVNADITKLQGEVKRTIDGYNKSQAPHIKIPVSVDESSIRKLQSRISALKNQLNSISNDKKTVSINTSLNLGVGEKAKVQKQVGDTKATMIVGLRLNPNDVKAVRTQIESIKAEVKAGVTAVQNHAGTMRRFGESRADSVGATAVNGTRRLTLRRNDRADKFIAERSVIVNEIKAIKENEKLLNAELKELTSKKEIEARIDALQNSKSKGKSYYHPKDENGNVIKGARVYAKDYDVTINSYKEALKKIDTINGLKSQLDSKQRQLSELERTATYGYKNASTIRPQHPLAQLNAQLEAERKAEQSKRDAIKANEKKIQDDAKKAQQARQREQDSYHKRAEAEDRKLQARKHNLVSNRGTSISQPSLEEQRLKQQRREIESAHRRAEVEDRKLQARKLTLSSGTGTIKTPKTLEERRLIQQRREIESAHKQAEREDRKLAYRNLVAPQVMADARAKLEQRKIESARAQAEREDRKREAKKISLAREKSLKPQRILNREVETAHAQAIKEERRRQAKLFSSPQSTDDIKKRQQRELDRAHAQAEREDRKRQAQEINRARIEADREKKRKENEAKKLQEQMKNTPTGKASSLPKFHRAREIARQNAEQVALQQAQNSSTVVGGNGLKASQRRAVNYNQGIVRYGGNKEFQGVDLEAKLKNPNVSLSESLGILNNQIHPRNQAEAKANNQNFQRAYTINYRDNEGHIRSVRTLTYEYTSLGDRVERGDRSFKALAGNMLRNIGVYTLFTSGFRMMSQAIGQAIQDMINFDAQLAQVGMVTQNLNTGQVSDAYQSFGSGTNEIKTKIQEHSFATGQEYGVSTMSTVLPVESQVLARTNLIKGKDGKIDPKMQQEMTDKIIQFSAVSTGGNASAEEVSAISKDVMSIYQAMYSEGDTAHMGKVGNLLDYMAIMKAKGVNTNAVADSMSELAPDTIKKNIDPQLVAGMLGAYNLSDVDATGANMTQIGKLFFGSLSKPNNPTVKKALDKMGIDSSKVTDTKELTELVMERFPTLTQKDQAEVAEGFAGLTGKSSAMTPKMTKFLEAISSNYVGEFDNANKETPNALEKSWDTFSNTLKRNFMELGEQVKELVQQLARLGLMDIIGLVVKGLSGLLNGINSVLHVMTRLSDAFSDNGLFNVPKMLMGLAGLALAVKGVTAVFNKLTPGVSSMIGDFFERNTGRRAGFKQVAGTAGGTVLSNAPIVAPVPNRVAPVVARGGSAIATTGYVASSLLPYGPVGSKNSRSIPVMGGTPHPRVVNPYAVMGANIISSMPVLGGTPHPRVRNQVSSTNVRTINGYASHYGPNSRQGTIQVLNHQASQMSPPSRTGRVASSTASAVGAFMSQALFLTSFRNGGVQRAGAQVAERSAGVFKGLGQWFVKTLPALRGFGLLLTRLTIIGTALASAWWVVSKVIDNAKKNVKDQYDTSNKNLKENSKAMMNDPKVAEKKSREMDAFISDNLKFMKESKDASTMGTDMSTKAIERNKRIADARKKFQDEYGLEFFSKGSGDDRQDFVKYHTLNGKGEMSKKAITANLNDKEDMEKFESARKNGFRGSVLIANETAKEWSINTDYVMDYNKALIDTNELTKEISRTTKMLGYNIDGIDAKFMGANSTTALREKINATSQGLGNISDERAKIQATKDRVDKNKSLLEGDLAKQILTGLSNGLSQKQVDEVNNEFLLAKQTGDTDTFMDKYQAPTDADQDKWLKGVKDSDGGWKVKPMTQEQVDAKMQESLLLRAIAEIVMKLSGLTDASDSITDAYLQNEQQARQQEQAMKEYTSQLLVMSTGIGIMEAQISKINSAVGMGRAMVQMAEPNSKEQINSQSGLIKVSSELLKGYRAELSSVTNGMNNIMSQNPGQDFSLNYLYNPGENGLSAQQSAYKELLEKQSQIQESVSSTTVDVYEQAQQLKEMVLNSDKYADVWERVQNRTQLVKDANKEIFDMRNDRAMVSSMSQIRSAVTGQNVNEIRQSKLESIRDRGLDNYEQLMSALKTYDGDAEKLSEAYDEINKTMGSEFDKAFIAPLKDIIANDFAEAGNKILDGADSLNTVLGNWAQFAMESASNPNSVVGQNEAFNNAMSIPTYGSNGVTKDSPFDKKLDAYMEQMGYKKGTKEYASFRRQLTMSMSRSELETEVDKSITSTSNNSSVAQYATTIDGKLGGKLSGYGNAFAKYGAQYGIDPRFLASIAMHETGNGTSNAVKTKNNVGGIMTSSGLKSFASMDEGIEALASLLKRLYFDQGLNTIPEIQRKYAPNGADNDPNGLNQHWQKGVARNYANMSGVSESSLLGGQAISTSAGTGGKTGSTAVSSSRSTVRRGSRGDDVKALQKALGISADGIFGAQTEKAVKAYQKKKGLDADGIVGSSTWSKLGLSGTSSTSSSSSKTGGKNPMSILEGLVNKSTSEGGIAYSWGGGHYKGDWDSFIKKAKADCSGLVQHFYREFAGVELGTGSSNMMWQNDQGKRITKKADLQVGDVVYFGTGGKVTHTGIYSGDGNYIGMNSGGPNRSGAPVKEDKLRSDFVGAKRYDGANSKLNSGTASSATKDGQVSALDILKSAIKSFIEAMKAEAQLKSPTPLKQAYYKDANISYGLGNIRDPLGTSGRMAVADRVVQERETVYQKRYETVEQLKQLGTARKNYAELANKALKDGDKEEYKEYSNAVEAIDKLVKTLTETNKKLGEWDKELNKKQLADPRINQSEASKFIRGGYDKLRSLQNTNEVGGPEYMRIANEINEMNGSYMTARNRSNVLGQVWQSSGVGTVGYNVMKRRADQEDANILFQKISQINGVLADFAEGTKDWYSTLEDAVAVQEELIALEEKRLANAQSMFELTGKGLDGYIQQKAYTTSKDLKRTEDNLSVAVAKHKSGEMDDTYKTQIGTGHYSKGTAEKIQKKLRDKYGVESSLVLNKETGEYYVNTQNGLTKEKAEEIKNGILKDGLGVKYSGTKKVTDGGQMNAHEELANLQIIAGLQEQLMAGIEEYRSAVVGAFKAGAMTLEEYLEKMNDLRDVQNEARENAIQLVDTLSTGIQEAFANALSGGMQGNMDSAQSFIDSVKQTIAGSISSSLASTLLNNTGLLDVVNGFIAKIAGAATSGNPDDIANMFNNNDFATELQNVLAPFLPLIEEIVSSTEGMFNIMKDQVFNAPEGYKIDQELYKVSKGKGVKDWDGGGKNGAGSPDSPTSGSNDPIVTPPTSNTPSGPPSGTSPGGVTGSPPNSTAPGGTGAPSTGSTTTTPKPDSTKVNTPKAPTKGSGSSSSHKHGTVNRGDRGAEVKEIQKAVGVPQDGIFGPKTEAAVKKFQKKHGLTADGIVGSKTWAAIHKTQTSSSTSKKDDKDDKKTTYKTTKTALNFRSSAKTGNNVISVLPKGTKVEYLGVKDGWAHVKYKGKTGYVGKSYIYHSGGIAGMMNFANPNKLRPDEVSAVLKKGEPVFTPNQVSSLVGGGSQTNNSSSGDVNFNIYVNVEGGQDKGSLQATVETAVKRAIQEVKRDQRFTNLTWKGTSY